MRTKPETDAEIQALAESVATDPEQIAMLVEIGKADRDLRQTKDTALREAVATARANGRTWVEIGQTLGVSRQAARERFGP